MLAIIPDIKEVHFNVSLILSHIKCELLKFPSKLVMIAADLKIVNILLGIQGHSCTHNCPYCEDCAPYVDSSAQRRTLGGIRRDHSDFASSGSSFSKAKYFSNVVNLSVIEDDNDVLIKDILVPPELPSREAGNPH